MQRLDQASKIFDVRASGHYDFSLNIAPSARRRISWACRRSARRMVPPHRAKPEGYPRRERRRARRRRGRQTGRRRECARRHPVTGPRPRAKVPDATIYPGPDFQGRTTVALRARIQSPTVRRRRRARDKVVTPVSPSRLETQGKSSAPPVAGERFLAGTIQRNGSSGWGTKMRSLPAMHQLVAPDKAQDVIVFV